MNTRKEYGTAGPDNYSYKSRRKAGIPVRTLYKDKADRWYKMYVDQKMSVREIARHEGVAYSTVHNQLKALLTPFRPRGQASGNPTSPGKDPSNFSRKAMVQGITKKLEENKSTATRLVDIETRLDALEHRADWTSSNLTTDQRSANRTRSLLWAFFLGQTLVNIFLYFVAR